MKTTKAITALMLATALLFTAGASQAATKKHHRAHKHAVHKAKKAEKSATEKK